MNVKLPLSVPGLVRLGLSGITIALVTFAGYQLHLAPSTVVLLYLLVVVLHSLAADSFCRAVVGIAATGCLDFFFVPPLFSFLIADPRDLLPLFTFLTVALVVTRLVSRTKEEARTARIRGTQREHLNEISRGLLFLPPDANVNHVIPQFFREVLSLQAVCLFDAARSELHTEGISVQYLAELTRQACRERKDIEDKDRHIVVRCLRSGGGITGAVGFQGYQIPN
jgi:K+-sensing histidine kinase KdpD